MLLCVDVNMTMNASSGNQKYIDDGFLDDGKDGKKEKKQNHQKNHPIFFLKSAPESTARWDSNVLLFFFIGFPKEKIHHKVFRFLPLFFCIYKLVATKTQ